MLKLQKPFKSLRGLESKTNLVPLLDPADATKIGSLVREGYDSDEASRADWFKRYEAAIKIALQIKPKKTFPWAGASNVAFPLLTVAALQFHSRAYPSLFQGSQIIKSRVTGTDPKGERHDRGRLLARFMSHQALDLDTAFEEQHDRLLISVPLVGTAFIKTTFGHGVNTPISEFVPAQDLAVDYYAKSVETAHRKTQIITLYQNEVYERSAEGRFIDVMEAAWFRDPAALPVRPHEHLDNKVSGQRPPSETFPAFLFYEQHTYLDLDGDGYAEPYIATIEHSTNTLVRLVARWDLPEDVERFGALKRVYRIRATEYYTKYELIPDPAGSIYGLGFGGLVGPLNESVDTLVNQIIDGGTLATTAGGFLAKGVKLRGGAMQMEPWAWKQVETSFDDLRKGVFPTPVREPPAVLFNLLSLLINYTQRIGGATDTMVGENPGQNTPATNMRIMVEQGTKVYSAIFKRLWRAMREEVRKRAILNAAYLREENYFGDARVLRRDFLRDPSDFIPTADPNLSSEQERFQQAVALREAAATNPAYNRDAIELNFIRSLGVDSPEEFYGSVADIPPAEDPKVTVTKMKIEADMKKFAAQHEETVRLNSGRLEEMAAKVTQILSTIDNAEAAMELENFRTLLQGMQAEGEQELEEMRLIQEAMASQGEQGGNTGGTGSMASPSSDAGVS